MRATREWLHANSTRMGRTGLVAAIVPTTTTTMFTAAIRGLDVALSAEAQALVIGQTEYRKEVEERLVRAYLAWRPDGIILTGGLHTPELELVLRRSGVAVAEMWTLRADPIGAAIGFSDRDAFLARFDQHWRRERIGRRDQADLAGLVIARAEDQPLFIG